MISDPENDERNRIGIRFSLAVVAVGLAFLLRQVVELYLDTGLPQFVFFYPFVVMIALFCGFWPGLLTTALSAMVGGYSVSSPSKIFSLWHVSDATAVAIFFGLGIFTCALSDRYRFSQRRVAALEREQAMRKTEMKLQQISEYQALALEAADLGAWEYCFETGEILWDECCRTAFGYTEGDRIDHDEALARIYSSDRPAFIQAAKKAIAGTHDGTYHQEFRSIWPDGSIHWLSSHGRVYFTGEEDVRQAVRFIGVVRDISGKKRVQESLQRTVAMLEAVGNNTSDLIFVKDIAGRMIYASPGTLRALNRTADQVLGRTDAELFSDLEEAITLMANDRQVMESGQRMVTEEKFTDSRGIHVLLSTKAPLLDSAGQVIGLVGMSRDITIFKRAEVIPFPPKMEDMLVKAEKDRKY